MSVSDSLAFVAVASDPSDGAERVGASTRAVSKRGLGKYDEAARTPAAFRADTLGRGNQQRRKSCSHTADRAEPLSVSEHLGYTVLRNTGLRFRERIRVSRRRRPPGATGASDKPAEPDSRQV